MLPASEHSADLQSVHMHSPINKSYFREMYTVPWGLLSEWDRMYQVGLSMMTMGVSPASVGLAYADWLLHLSLLPGKQVGLCLDAAKKNYDLCSSLFQLEKADVHQSFELAPIDKRFKNKAWELFPFNLYKNSFLSFQSWCQSSVEDIKGLSGHHAEVLKFINRQILDALSPANFVVTNPVIQEKIRETYGLCLVLGAWHFFDDYRHLAAGKLPRHLQPFTVGKDMAITPGKVVYRNRLMELIQYAPATNKVYSEPVLIVPAWIMKYYILDLKPEQSLVEYLVKQGYTVFLISWKNPTEEDRDLGFNDYMKLSFIKSLDVINNIIPNQKIHAAGYCIGGILLTIGMAWLNRLKDDRIKTMTLLAAQTDFDQAGELLLFMDESQLAFLDNIMQQQGFLGKHQMKSIFQLMRSNDLIWSYLTSHYLKGERTQVTEMMAWSADSTRMPYRMHKEYLEKLYLHDELAEGHYKVDDKEVVLDSIKVPVFCVATEADHLSPWKSVYKLHLETDTEITFVLTNGGHNAGIVSYLNHPRRHYRISTTPEDAAYISPDEWLNKNPKEQAGSWWPEWSQWLAKKSTKSKVLPPTMGNKTYPPLCDAPGTYVHQK